ncbi:TIGR01777 family oxidoreductase [Wenzhouxiangella limi]|uniref:TIGR01777 family protein n=1 Tax=Wenzhouxiangella limi TaxID=2707351 RepID=A0A845V5K1_9GAMM|nr:TIGR01777 family oxidoreductase [Wenzhouxiangella limi]NDY95481.1 TIGR01777 family protein [Wenzhouxiangella limi]
MKILVTGGSGFIGQKLCADLARDGHIPLVVSRAPDKAARKLPDSAIVRPSAADFVDESPEAVVNLAGEPIAEGRWTESKKKALVESRVDITRAVVDLCRRAEPAPRVLVSASAVGYYGDQGEREVTEQTPPHDEFAHQLCKRWEAEAHKAEEHGVRVAIVRIGLVLDAGGGMLAKTTPVFKLGLGGKLGNGEQYMPWIHREDMVGAIRFLLERDDLSGPFNASAPNPVTNAEFTRELGRALHRPAVLPAPALALKLAFGEMSRLLLTGAKMLPARLEEAGYEFRFRKLDQALSDIFSR